MEESTLSLNQLGAVTQQFARRLVIIGENRMELLIVEVQEERGRLLHALLLGLGMAGFGFLAVLTLTATLVVWLWIYSPAGVLLGLTFLYSAAGVWLYQRVTRLLRDWETLPSTFNQLRKDLVCLKKALK